MFKNFICDARGNFAMLLAIAMVPIMGVVALAIDYSEMSRHRHATLNALDAANMATARHLLSGKSELEVRQFAQNFFEANLAPVKPENVILTVRLPDENAGGNTLTMQADLKYYPIFYGSFLALMGKSDKALDIDLKAQNEVRLKNTLEVALVLDNSGSMTDKGSGSGKPRIDLLKEAAKQLVQTLAKQGTLMKQLEKPVQFGLVPFSSAVNVGPQNANADWMDTEGRSPIHHENFDWSTMPASLRVEKKDGVYIKTGTGWGKDQNTKATRFSLFNDIKGTCNGKNCQGSPVASWAGCVEVRPYPYGADNTEPSKTTPETLFVPMFAPDETDLTVSNRTAYNNWWVDESKSNSLNRQRYMPKYFAPGRISPGAGPNLSCGTTPITPLEDVTSSSGERKIIRAIDEMIADGATNVSEGIAWGWRVVSSREPFTQARGDHEKGNDKVVIVLTDGANTYYAPDTLSAPNRLRAYDDAGNKSTYSNYGYARTGRIFDGTNVSRTTYTNANYTRAMNQHMKQVCDNAKASKIIVMTVALDLSKTKTDEKEQIDLLEACASESRVRRGEKLFWNTTGAELAETFRSIADELSNLRFID